MSGGFALGPTDPVSGRRRGRAAGTELALQASVQIADIRAFEADPDHEGTLSGSIVFDPLGGSVEAEDGVFNLFAPDDDGRTKWMIYEMRLAHEEGPYYLAGRKEVRDDPGFDLWSDTTTLYTRLHEGTNTDGEVVGAGVLTLGVQDLIELLGTMRATGTTDTAEKVEAFGTFGRLFMGELWDTYARHARPDTADE